MFRVTGGCPFCPAFSGLGGPVNNSNQDIVPDLRKLFASSITNRYAAGAAIAALCGPGGH